jgi:uncharacterized glyoxalase superfamily protein PhnB
MWFLPPQLHWSTGPGELPAVAFDEPEQRRDLHQRESVAWPCGTGFERPDADPAELLDYARALDVEGPVRRVVEAVLSPTQCYVTAGQTIKRCPHREMSAKAYDETAPVIPEVSIQVDDVDAAYAAAVQAGAEVVHPLTNEPWGVGRFFVRDPDGHVLNVLGHR